MTLLTRLLFSEISTTGFALMRMGWAITVLWYGIAQSQDITRYFSESGILPHKLEVLVTRQEWRFTILDYVTDPRAVFLLYLIEMLAALCMLLGVYPKLMTVIAVLLQFSFHERNPLSLGGGDTVLRTVGFLLILAPTGRAFSLERLEEQWKSWCKTKRLLPSLTMPSWPQTLILWQLIVIYVTSGWDKLLGDMWIQGTAVSSALHHPHFARYPMWVMDIVGTASPVISIATILFEFMWLLLLFPQRALALLGLTHGVLKRSLFLMGVLFHGGIFVFMDVGSFSPAILSAYLGILDDADFKSLKIWLNHRFRGAIAVLYDGRCGLCIRTAFFLALLDHLRRLRLIDYHDAAERTKVAPDLQFKDLDRVMHVRFSKARTEKGFDAFRALSWHLPALWPLAPLLHVPGVPLIGRRIYAAVAESRKKCTHESCAL